MHFLSYCIYIYFLTQVNLFQLFYERIKITIRVTPNSIDFGELIPKGSIAKIEFEPLCLMDRKKEWGHISIIPDFKVPPGTVTIIPARLDIPYEKTKKDLTLTITNIENLEPGSYEGKIKFSPTDEEIELIPSSVAAEFSIVSLFVSPNRFDFGRLKKGNSRNVTFSITARGLSFPRMIRTKVKGNNKTSFIVTPSKLTLIPNKSEEISVTLRAIGKIPWWRKYRTEIIFLDPDKHLYTKIPLTVAGPLPWGFVAGAIFSLMAVAGVLLVIGWTRRRRQEEYEKLDPVGTRYPLDFKEVSAIRLGREKKGEGGIVNEIILHHHSVAPSHAIFHREEQKEGIFVHRIEILGPSLRLNDELMLKNESSPLKKMTFSKLGITY